MRVDDVSWDPVARDKHGAPLSAAERCHGCWHEWLAHDHAYAAYGSPEFGRCLVNTSDGRCGCDLFIPAPDGETPHYAAPPLTAPLPAPPTPHPRHAQETPPQ